MIEDVFDAEGIKSNTLAVRARLRLFEVLEQESPGIRSHPPSFDVRVREREKEKERSRNQECGVKTSTLEIKDEVWRVELRKRRMQRKSKTIL